MHQPTPSATTTISHSKSRILKRNMGGLLWGPATAGPHEMQSTHHSLYLLPKFHTGSKPSGGFARFAAVRSASLRAGTSLGNSDNRLSRASLASGKQARSNRVSAAS